MVANKKIFRILLINGPNLNLLGTREPEKYGSTTLEDIERAACKLARELGAELDCFQSNSEGALVDRIHAARGEADAIVVNPGAYTHTSIALADAIAGVAIPTFEIHISNIYRREVFRHHSHIAPVAVGQISGFGPHGYALAIRAAVEYLQKR